MRLRTIKNETDYAAALAETERLFDARPGTAEGDRFEVLTTLLEAYERKHHPVPAPDPVEAIRYTLESRGLGKSDLVPLLGTPQRVNEVLTRRRRLTLGMVRRLHTGLGISADVLIQPYLVQTA